MFNKLSIQGEKLFHGSTYGDYTVYPNMSL